MQIYGGAPAPPYRRENPYRSQFRRDLNKIDIRREPLVRRFFRESFMNLGRDLEVPFFALRSGREARRKLCG